MLTTNHIGSWVQPHGRKALAFKTYRHILGTGYRALCGARPRGGWSSAEMWRNPCPTCTTKQEAAQRALTAAADHERVAP